MEQQKTENGPLPDTAERQPFSLVQHFQGAEQVEFHCGFIPSRKTGTRGRGRRCPRQERSHPKDR
ncbi:hypothetical protein GCM10010417_03940 [Streptomyces carpaticus]